VIDATGHPKAAYWLLGRACRPLALFLIDEGLNGLRAHAINDTPHPLSADLVVTFFRDGRTRTNQAESSLALPPRSAVELSIDALLGHFIDPSYAYQFGPPSHDLAIASLVERVSRTVLAEAVHFPLGPPAARRADLEIRGALAPHPLGFVITLSANAFAYGVHVDADGYEPADDYFHLSPGRDTRLLLRSTPESSSSIKVRVTAVNGSSALRLRAEQEARRSA
jgi:beta-mannosidase